MRSFDASPFVLPPRQERSRAALARIVKAAEDVMAEHGIDGFSMADIAEAAAMPVGNIYRRFKGKDDIVRAIKLDVTSRIESTIVKRLEGQKFDKARDLVFAHTEALAAAFEKDEALHHALFKHSTIKPLLSEIGDVGKARIFENYQRALLPLLKEVPSRRRETVVRVSFQMTAAPFLTKAAGNDALLADISWTAMAREFGEAASRYLELH